MLTAPFAETGLTHNEVQDFLRKGDDDAACQSQETVGALRRVVGLEAETDLNDTPAEQDKTDRTNESENKVGQVVYDGNGITRSKGGHAHTPPRLCRSCHERKCFLRKDCTPQLLPKTESRN